MIITSSKDISEIDGEIEKEKQCVLKSNGDFFPRVCMDWRTKVLNIQQPPDTPRQ